MTSREAENPVQLDDLYREVILDHYRHPRNQGALADATVEAEGFNPSCGDELRVAIVLTDGAIRAIGFQGRGCSISQSSASMLTDAVRSLSIADVRALSASVQEMLTHEDFDVDSVEIGDLEALQGVAKFPVRIKCALLAWKVLEQALADATGEQFGGDSDIQTRVTIATVAERPPSPRREPA